MMILTAGNRNAEVAIVGDCLSMDDYRLGRAFMGTQGMALKEPLIRLGYDINNDFYFTYFNKKSTDCAHLIRCLKDRKKGSGRDVHIQTYSGYDEHVSVLVEELSSMPNLKYIIALGDIPLHVLTNYWGASYRRGSVYRWIAKPEVLILAMEHPRIWVGYHDSYNKYKLGDIVAIRLGHKDLQKFKKGLYIDEPKIVIGPTAEEALSFIHMCKENGMCALDIECSRDNFTIDGKTTKPISCFSLSYSKDIAISIPILNRDSTSYYPQQSFNQIITALKDLCWDKNVIKIFQNALFDTYILWKEWGVHFRNLKDTMVCFGILYPDFRKGLDTITSVCTNIPYYKDEGKEFISLNSTGESFWRYNGLDAVATYHSYIVLEDLIKTNGLADIVNKQNALIEPLLYIMKRGFRFDNINKEKLLAECNAELAEYYKEFMSASKLTTDINLRSDKQLRDYFYGKLGLNPYKSRTTGNATLDETALRRLSRRGIKEATILLNYKKVNSFITKYLNVTTDDDGRLRGQYNPVGTTSGRLSCGKTSYNTGLNMQTLPENFKGLVLADPNYLVYEMDLSGAENRIVAYIAPDLNMINAFENNIDLHCLTASFICNLPVDEIKRQNDAKPTICAPIGSGDKSWRFWGKKANHGLNYGQGFDAFSMQNEIPREEAKFIVERYYSAYPGLSNYHRWVENQLTQTRILTNLFGRKRIYLKRIDDDMLREAYSFIPQSTVADIINHFGLKYIWENRYGWSRYVEPLNIVHDSIVFQIPISVGMDYHVDFLKRLKKALEVPLYWKGRMFKLPVTCEVGVSLNPKKKLNLNQHTFNIKENLKDIANELLLDRRVH